MKTYFGIFSNGQINKYRHKFTVSALEDGVWQAGVYGIPMHLSHDMHKLIGWSIPFGLYFAPGITYTVGQTLIAENDEESKQIINARENALIKRYNEDIEPYKENFIELLGRHYSPNGCFHYPSCATFIKENILYDIFPNLKDLAKQEKAGLIYLSDLLKTFDYKGHGVFKNKESEFLVFAHPYFRRSLSRFNNFHFEFLDQLMSLNSSPDVTVRLSLDYDMVGFAPSLLESFEYEYWWGPTFNDDIEGIKPGLAQYGSDEFEKIYYNIINTDFYWKHNGSKYEFELEEVRNEPAPTLQDTYGCRYIHSIFDKDQEVFDHFDGAIRGYDMKLMLDRLDSKLTDFGRRSNYSKIFRVDGKLPVSKWKSLVTNYLQGNPQIYEYFGLEKPNVKQIVKEDPKTVVQTLIPYSINMDEGIRMLVSYHEQKELINNEREVSIFETLSFGTENHRAIEYDVFELKKAIERLGGSLEISSDALHIITEDMYVNFPCILHANKSTQELIDKTLDAFRMLFKDLLDTKNEKVIAFTLAWNMEDKEARVSIYGYVKDLHCWLRSFDSIPVERQPFKAWLEKQALYLSKLNCSSYTPDLSEMVKYDGVLFINRRLVKNDVIMELERSSEGINFKMIFEDHQEQLLSAVQNREVVPIMACIANKIICEQDGENYIDSPKSTYLDKDVRQQVIKHTPFGVFWTDKPA